MEKQKGNIKMSEIITIGNNYHNRAGEVGERLE